MSDDGLARNARVRELFPPACIVPPFPEGGENQATPSRLEVCSTRWIDMRFLNRLKLKSFKGV